MTERPDPETVGQALEVRREAEALGMPLPAMDDSELSRLWRTARALAESRLFKDATQASQAFAKIIAGRDLGLTPFEAMGSLHIVEGKIEAGGDLHATRVRSREGYDFRVAWIKEDEHGRVAVYASEDKATDLREVVGCAIEFTVDGELRGVSRWTVEDSERAGLMRPSRNGAPSNHKRYPRNMFFNRAMTNGVAWYVPEVMGGMRVYGLGEVETSEDLTASDRGPIGTERADDLPTAVEAVVARASELGHRGLANREAAAMAVSRQSQEVVDDWLKNATQELNRLATGKPEPTPEPAPPDAEVVDDPAKPTEEEQRAADELGVPIVSQGFLDDGPPRKAEPREQTAQAQELRERATELQEDAEGFAESDQELAQELREKADELLAEADAMDDGA